jgi:hypothetical protein
MVSLEIEREGLFAAISQLEILADWIQEREPEVRAWHARARASTSD